MDDELAIVLGTLSLGQESRDNHEAEPREKSTAVHRHYEKQETAQKKTYVGGSSPLSWKTLIQVS
jgi:hypothetical protein